MTGSKLNSASSLSQAEKKSFIINVYRVFIYSLLLSAFSSFVGVQLQLPFSWWWIALELVVLIVCLVLQKSVTLLYLWTIISGFTSAPILSKIISEGNQSIIWQAILITAFILLLLSLYVHFTKKDFSHWNGILLLTLTIIVLCAIILVFFPKDLMDVIITSLSILIFCSYVLFDTSNIINKYGPGDEVMAALDLHLDFINLFLDLISLFRWSIFDSSTNSVDTSPDSDIDLTDMTD